MILKQPTAPNGIKTLLISTAILSIAIGVLTAQPTTQPKTQPATTIGKLLAAAPKGWSAQGPMRLGKRNMNPGPHFSRVPAKYIKLRSRLVLTKEGLQREAPPIIVWLAQRQAEKIAPKASPDQQDVELKVTEHLGPGSGFHVYLHLPPGAAKLWPTARADIARVLGVKLPTTRPAEKTEPAESTITITLRSGVVSYAFNGIASVDTKALAKSMGEMTAETPLIIQIETNVPYKHVAEVLAAAHKIGLKHISITVIRTSRPPTKPVRSPGLRSKY